MLLKIYHVGGGVKYSGISSTIPKEMKYKFRNPCFKLYDIGGIMLYLFQENSFMKEFNEKGELSNIGFIKNKKIVKEMKKIIEDTNSISDNEEDNYIPFEENNISYENLNSNMRTIFSDFLSEISQSLGQTTNISFQYQNVEVDTESSTSYDEYEEEYEGEVILDIPNGKGIFYEKENSPQYIGYWLEGRRHGKGIFYKKNEKIYYGEWKQDKRVGFGISFSNGKKIFEGIWKNDFPSFGKIYSSEEDIIYNGLFSEYIGNFIYYHINLEETYQGTFKNGKRDGYGEIIDSENIVRYSGQWKNDKRDGYGEQIYTGGKYKGYWKNNEHDGYGIFYDISYDNLDNKVYEKDYSGYWKNGKKEGEGIEFLDNETIMYEGEFKNDKRYKGIEYYEKNGNLMYGGYFNGYEFEGKGILYYPNSQNICFEGTFKNGNPCNGISYNENGTEENKTKIIDGNYYTFSKTFYDNGDLKYEGYFKNGIYHGEGTLKTVDGKKEYKGMFLNGLYWNGEDTLRYIDFYTNPIIFKGSLKNESYFNGIEYIYEDGDIYYDLDPVFYQKWQDGEPINEEKERFELRQEMKILSYLETKQKKKLEKTYKKDYLHFLEKKYKIIKKENLKKKELISLIENEYYSKKNEIMVNEGEYDLFGNEMINPVKGFDGEIYDESSMIYLFERDEKMEFKHIPYIYNEQNERVPNYPIMSNGKPLNGYQKGEIKIYENDREYIKKY